MPYKQGTSNWVSTAIRIGKRVGNELILVAFWTSMVALACGFLDTEFNVTAKDLQSGLIQGISIFYIALTLHKLTDKYDDY